MCAPTDENQDGIYGGELLWPVLISWADDLIICSNGIIPLSLDSPAGPGYNLEY
jgi:hypothetical protein